MDNIVNIVTSIMTSRRSQFLYIRANSGVRSYPVGWLVGWLTLTNRIILSYLFLCCLVRLSCLIVRQLS